VYISKNPVSVDADARAEVETFLEALDADDDVQTIFVGLVP
jgi:transcriptional/translational regulatory protein YebC/TACO1